MLSVHFRRIALAQGLLAVTAEKSRPIEASRATAAPAPVPEGEPGDRPASSHPDPRKAS